MKVKILVDDSGEELFHCLSCIPEKKGLEYELFAKPTNHNQCEMFCDACRAVLGYDHTIQITKSTYEYASGLAEKLLSPERVRLFGLSEALRIYEDILSGTGWTLDELLAVSAVQLQKRREELELRKSEHKKQYDQLKCSEF